MANIRIDLTNLGENQYVEIRDPKFLSWGKQRELTQSLKDDSTESRMAFAEKLAVVLIRSGFVLDEDGNTIQFPLTDETVGNIPSLVVEAVGSTFADIRKSSSVPNG